MPPASTEDIRMLLRQVRILLDRAVGIGVTVLPSHWRSGEVLCDVVSLVRGHFVGPKIWMAEAAGRQFPPPPIGQSDITLCATATLSGDQELYSYF